MAGTILPHTDLSPNREADDPTKHDVVAWSVHGGPTRQDSTVSCKCSLAQERKRVYKLRPFGRGPPELLYDDHRRTKSRVLKDVLQPFPLVSSSIHSFLEE